MRDKLTDVGVWGIQASSYTAGGQTVHFGSSCEYFTEGKAKASTLSLSVLVAIEMFNALNALSEVSLLSVFRRSRHSCRLACVHGCARMCACRPDSQTSTAGMSMHLVCPLPELCIQ